MAKVWEMHKEEVLIHATTIEKEAVPGYLRHEEGVISKRLHQVVKKQYVFCVAVLG